MQKNIQISLHTLTDFCSFFLSEILSFSIIFDRKIDKRGGKKYTIDTNKQRMHKFPTMQQKTSAGALKYDSYNNPGWIPAKHSGHETNKAFYHPAVQRSLNNAMHRVTLSQSLAKLTCPQASPLENI